MSESSEPGYFGLAPESPRRAVQLLKTHLVFHFLIARIASSLGIWVFNVVSAVVVFDLSRSTLTVGMISVAQFGPQIIVTPFMGALADRLDRRRQAAWGYTLAALGSGVVAVTPLLGGSWGASAGLVVFASFVVGLGLAVGAPAAQAIIPTLARPEELPVVVPLVTAPMTVSRAIGPGLGVVLLLHFGPAAAFGTAGLLLFGAGVILVLSRPEISQRPSGEGSSVIDGFRYLREDRTTAVLLGSVIALGFGVDSIVTLSPAVADSMPGGGATLVAMITTAFGVGAMIFILLSGALRARYGHERLASIGLWILGGGLSALAFATTHWLATLTALIAGAGMMSGMTSLSTQIQERVPDSYRGRVTGLWLVGFVGSRPLAAMLTGTLSDRLSPTVALIAVAVVLLIGGYTVLPSRLSRATSE